MSTNYFLFVTQILSKCRFVSLVGLLCISISSCEEIPEECKLGGVVGSNYYLFWIKEDFNCGQITVTVTGPNGKQLKAINDVIKITTSFEPPDCDFQTSNLALFALAPGKVYSYKAFCTGKSWSGTIAKTCDQYQCSIIQLE
jgi:hypothetical protein